MALPFRIWRPTIRVMIATLVLLSTTPPPAMIAQQTPTPTPAIQDYRGSGGLTPYRGDFSNLAIEIDGYWTAAFEEAGVPYQAPDIFTVEQLTFTACGPVEPVPNAFYCPGDRTIYLVPDFLLHQELQFGDFAPMAILSHEWGHHVQALLNIIGFGPPTKTTELQADCLMGAFIRHADERRLLDYGDFLEAIDTAIDAGDETPLPEDAPGAHGQPEDRVKALTKGYGGGPVAGCALPMETVVTLPQTQVPSILAPGDITSVLPVTLPLNHADCFRTERGGTLSFEELVQRLGGTTDARSRLQGWGWQASGFRTFGCDGPPSGEAGWVDIGVHLFSSVAAAQQAVDYFAVLRGEGTDLLSTTPPLIGDAQAALLGPAINGTEYTLYASRGPLLIRVTAVSSSGTPTGNVQAIVERIVGVTTSPASLPGGADVSPYLPRALPLAHGGCFQMRADQALTFDELITRFDDQAEAAARLQDWGWQASAYREFACDAPPSGEAAWIDVSVHRLGDPTSAQQAVTYFADARASSMGLMRGSAPPLGDSTTAVAGPTSNGKEFTLYASAGPFIVRVTGVASTGIPFSNVFDVASDVLASIEG